MRIRIQLYNTAVWGLNFVKVIYLNSCVIYPHQVSAPISFPMHFFCCYFQIFHSWIRIEEGPCGAGSTIHSPAFLISLHTINKQINKTKFIFLFPNPGPTKKLQIRWKIRIFLVHCQCSASSMVWNEDLKYCVFVCVCRYPPQRTAWPAARVCADPAQLCGQLYLPLGLLLC